MSQTSQLISYFVDNKVKRNSGDLDGVGDAGRTSADLVRLVGMLFGRRKKF
jgi:hypothetical protein